MNHACGVCRSKPFANRRGDRDDVVHGERTDPCDARTERLSFDELHRDEFFAGVLADVEDAGDVDVGHPPRELHLAPESLEDPRLREQLTPEDLERHHLVQLEVAGPVHRAHTADAEEPLHLVAPRQADAASGKRFTSHRRVHG